MGSDRRCHLREWQTRPTNIGTEEEATIKNRIGSLRWLRKQIEDADTGSAVEKLYQLSCQV